MPILSCLTVPDATWQSVVDACQAYGVECVFFRGGRKALRREGNHKYKGKLRVLYAEDIKGLLVRGYLKKMEESSQYNYLIIFGAPPNRFSNIPTYEGSLRSLVASHFEISLVDDGIEVDLSEYDHHREVMSKYSRDSILNRVSQLLYRIKDRVERDRVANQVYRFLAGVTKRPPTTPIKQLNEVLSSDLGRRYNEACRMVVKGECIDWVSRAYSVDWFEISYCIRKTTTDPRILEMLAFKEP